MKKISEKQWLQKLEEDGFDDLRVCPIAAGFDSGEHTHDEHTVHVILTGELTIIDKTEKHTYYPGDKVEFPASTTHIAQGGNVAGSMIVGVKRKTYPATYISISINASPEKIYAFASNPIHLPQWATGLSGTIENKNGIWIADSALGKVIIKFAEQNTFGVLDHDVTLSGKTFYNPMRVFRNDKGSEVVFTLYRLPGMSDAQFTEDAATIKKDLEKLKKLME